MSTYSFRVTLEVEIHRYGDSVEVAHRDAWRDLVAFFLKGADYADGIDLMSVSIPWVPIKETQE